jgi:hypothetical protein
MEDESVRSVYAGRLQRKFMQGLHGLKRPSIYNRQANSEDVKVSGRLVVFHHYRFAAAVHSHPATLSASIRALLAQVTVRPTVPFEVQKYRYVVKNWDGITSGATPVVEEAGEGDAKHEEQLEASNSAPAATQAVRPARCQSGIALYTSRSVQITPFM